MICKVAFTQWVAPRVWNYRMLVDGSYQIHSNMLFVVLTFIKIIYNENFNFTRTWMIDNYTLCHLQCNHVLKILCDSDLLTHVYNWDILATQHPVYFLLSQQTNSCQIIRPLSWYYKFHFLKWTNRWDDNSQNMWIICQYYLIMEIYLFYYHKFSTYDLSSCTGQ